MLAPNQKIYVERKRGQIPWRLTPDRQPDDLQRATVQLPNFGDNLDVKPDPPDNNVFKLELLHATIKAVEEHQKWNNFGEPLHAKYLRAEFPWHYFRQEYEGEWINERDPDHHHT